MAQDNDVPDEAAPDEEVPPTENVGSALPRPPKLIGATYTIETPLGKAYVTVNRSEESTPFEVFVNLGKAGSDLSADAEAIGRLTSVVLRVPLYPSRATGSAAEGLWCALSAAAPAV